MIKRVKSSLAAKVFLITAVMLLCIALLVFGLLAWLMPQTYSNRLNAILDERTQNFISELEQTTFSESGGLFDQFLQNEEINSVELYNANGWLVPLSTEEFYKEQVEATTQEQGLEESSPVLSNNYYFSFSDSSDLYMLIVSGTAEQIAELQQSFLRIFPLLILIVFVISLFVSWAYSRIITKPVLDISRVSEQMSALHLEWKVDEQRTDELGTLGKSLNTLSRNLSATLDDLQNAKKKLEDDIEREKQLEQARTDFFSAVSHELKTPITIIKGQLEGMILGIGVYKNHEKYLARALEVANILEAMVQEILTITRLETAGGDLKKDYFDCVPMIRAYLNETEDLMVKKGLQIHLDMPSVIFIRGSKILLEKVFSNLIGNAMMYSPQGASIWISAGEEHEGLVVSVENTGTHIPEDMIPKLFDAFYRVEQSRSRETGGMGLGLYLVQEILHQHESECKVCNTQAGVKFSFLLPNYT